MRSVQLVQLNNSYGDQVYLPYSVGILQSYVSKSEKVKSGFSFNDFIFLRESISQMAEKAGECDILGISCYVWNWELSTQLAKAVKKKRPACVVILGGPHVPDNDDKFFDKYPYVDITVHGEGEVTFLEILENIHDNKSLKNIPGSTYNCLEGVSKGTPRGRIKELDSIPSPYLEGTFDKLLKDNQYKWMVTWETNRGCPFKCSFCDWGSATASKVRKFSEERLFDEIDYFTEKKIELVFGADANFGIFKRDRDFAIKLSQNKKDTGWPNQFRVCFTKNSTDKIFDLAKIFADAGMNKGVSVSMQSMNKTTLKNIERANIKLGTFKELQKKYVAAGLVTYTELILPLPGETYETFVSGINELLDSAQHSGIVIYNCTVMPNAEMGSKEYIDKFEIDAIESPIFQAHSDFETDDIMEKELVVVGTKTMPRHIWRKTYKFAWAIQCFHMLGLLQPISIVLRHRYGIEYGTFYESFIDYFEKRKYSVVGRELSKIDILLDKVFLGKGFDQTVQGFLDVTWPAEEAAFLRISCEIDKFYAEVKKFVKASFSIVERDLLRDLINYQKNLIVNWEDDPNQDNVFYAKYDIHSYFNDLRAGKVSSLIVQKTRYDKIIENDYRLNKKEFSRKVVWYGRKGGKFFNTIESQKIDRPILEKAFRIRRWVSRKISEMK